MKRFSENYKVIKELILKRFEIRKIYKEGIGKPFFVLRYMLPFILIVAFLFLIDSLALNEKSFIDMIKQMNSLVGIILGFSIASFAIFISISNDKLEDTSQQTTYTYREIGSSLFFYNVEISLFTSLIGIILLSIQVPVVNITDIFYFIKSDTWTMSMFFNVKILVFMVYIVMFFQLILNLFYSSLFLNSSIKKGK